MRDYQTPSEKRAEREAMLKLEMDLHAKRPSLVSDEERKLLPPDKLKVLAHNRWMELRIRSDVASQEVDYA